MRCKAGNEWIEGDVKPEVPASREGARCNCAASRVLHEKTCAAYAAAPAEPPAKEVAVTRVEGDGWVTVTQWERAAEPPACTYPWIHAEGCKCGATEPPAERQHIYDGSQCWCGESSGHLPPVAEARSAEPQQAVAWDDHEELLNVRLQLRNGPQHLYPKFMRHVEDAITAKNNLTVARPKP